MKCKEKQRQKLDTSKKRLAAESSSDDDEDSDAERNFALLAEKEQTNEDTCEDIEGSETGDEEEEEAEGEGDAEASASEDDEDSDEDEGVEEEETAGGSNEIQTREDVKKGKFYNHLWKLECSRLVEVSASPSAPSELSNMSFEDVLKLQNQVGTKVYNQVAYGGTDSGGGSTNPDKRRKQRQNKNR